jgi:lactate dehydrogenase-like 2-hydroxyacid dehydrogenase
LSLSRVPAVFAHLLFLGFTADELNRSSWERVDAVCGRRTLLEPGSPELAEELRSADGLLLKLGMGADRTVIDAAPAAVHRNARHRGGARRSRARRGAGDRRAQRRRLRDDRGRRVRLRGAARPETGPAPGSCRALAGELSEASFGGTEIAGKTFGVLGLGRIGRRVAHMARAGFGADTVYWSRASRSDEPGIALVDRLELFARADILSLHLAHTSETEGLVDAAAFDAMRPDAVVVNTGLMELVSLPALERKLDTESFTFILDHPESVPPAGLARLVGRPNCIVYPSIGYTTAEAWRAKEELFVRAMENYLAGTL